jgi:hypothetical protein
MRCTVVLLTAAACFAQSKGNIGQTGVVDGHLASWRFPESTFAGLPTAAVGNTGWRYTVTDCLTSACTAGGGSVQADLRSTGSAWVVITGGGPQCTSNIVPYTSLTAASASQEITIQTGVSGNMRWDQILVSETTKFTGTTGLTVSMGRPGSSDAEMTGTLVPLMVSSGDVNYWSARPIPPQLTGTYAIVLNFSVTSGNVNAATAGALTWEVCGYAAR